MKQLLTYSKPKTIIIIMVLIFLSTYTFAQNVSFTANSEKVVSVGEQFRIVYSVNTQPSGFRAPNFKGFEILMGPATSTNSSIQIINGKTTQSVTISYTYIVQASKEGTYTIEGAQITVDGKQYTSNNLIIEVITGNKSANTSNNNSNNQNTKTSGEDIFVRVNVNKTKVYQGEPIIATLKIYTKLGLVGFEDMKFPSYNGFWSNDIEMPKQITLDRENVNGQIYQVGLLKQSILFPQQTGSLSIESAKIDVVVQKVVGQAYNWWGQLVPRHQEVSLKLTSPVVRIEVSPLPANKPVNFSGAVGSDFKLIAELDKQNLKVNEGLSLKIKLTGNGNIKLINPLPINIPAAFEKYDPKIDENIKYSTTGAIGYKVMEYILVAREPGEFTIDPVEFSYFDLNSKQYKTISTRQFDIKIEGTASNANNTTITTIKTDVENIGSDIQHIFINNFNLHEKDKFFFASKEFYLIYLIALFVFITFVILKRKHIKQNSDIEYVKNKKANKTSIKRLKTAHNYLKSSNKDAFFDEVARALWGYVSDKLSIPTAELTRDNISEHFTKYNIESEIIQKFIKILNDCEIARYSPSGDTTQMDTTYNEAMNIITQLENKLKISSKNLKYNNINKA